MLNMYPVAVRRSLFGQDDRIILVFFQHFDYASA